jgi:lysophospholipase L1-like esterase
VRNPLPAPERRTHGILRARMYRPLALLACACVALMGLAPAVAQAAQPTKRFYVSLGDSYASGWQPTGVGQGRNTRNGFAYQVPRLAARRGYRLVLANFGCGAATATSLIEARGCPPVALGPGGRAYPRRTQLAAAERFLRAHRRRTALVSVSIGGNDVTACVRAADPVACVATAATTIKRNVTTIARRLRRAAGRRVRIVGSTYPDVILGAWVNGDAASQTLARLSVVAFQSLINPALRQAYRSAGGRFVDVTAASGAYVPFERVTTLYPYGSVPVAVARVCELTYYCAFRDIHLRTDGYRLIAELVARQLPRRR